MQQADLIKNNKKLSDVVSSTFGFTLFNWGLSRPNFFSDFSGLGPPLSSKASIDLGDISRKNIMTNTVEDILKLFKLSNQIDLSNLADKSTKELESDNLFLIKRVESLETLYRMCLSVSDTSKTPVREIQKGKEYYTQLYKNIQEELHRRKQTRNQQRWFASTTCLGLSRSQCHQTSVDERTWQSPPISRL